MKTSATISSCGLYRYELRRIWDETKPRILFIGLNPSTADAEKEDNTSRVCINYAKRWGYGALLMGNLFAYRSTDQKKLRLVSDPIGPDNDAWLKRLQAEAQLVVCAWTKSGKFMGRSEKVLSFINNPHCLIQGKDGYPGHPLYKKSDLTPVPLIIRSSSAVANAGVRNA
ncbi:MAG: DUF1643 domain-containing protein [Alphaproteobacteria bacterium]|jgi:hypothetical protein|nr:DUF1643 domain-containing protein [Alphaproteobacteria bacterium]